ncbi:hypothetical protein OGH69_14110 [Flavobacterium sp. MFBS3-15]|uniref:hypothetical protein n=1 Tax=Flavobacterium sp. MFBS3-15 TaxID=2989816 RepID=UPI002235FC8E|nr:hypothetical protein [Flavobacterium sp. MFBS3-15]MCW4470107.1 hypothetical protein [Flavobacterium sp. MFBS3-15]
MSKNISKYRKQYLKALAEGKLNNAAEYRYGITGYGRIVWGTIITLSAIVIGISLTSSGNGSSAW